MYSEDQLVSISALQHVLFCERQCALIHVERLWHENRFTAEGRIMHDRAHSKRTESRPGVRTEFGMPIRSLELGVAGMADVVEFRDPGSIIPVEYKRGRPKGRRMDEVQLCAQALCLEEMLGVTILDGAIFYGKERRRTTVEFDEVLRELTRRCAERVHEIIETALTPPPVYTKVCKRCSLVESCLPLVLSKRRTVAQYIDRVSNAELGVEGQE